MSFAPRASCPSEASYPPQEALRLIEQVNRENMETLEVPEYKEANPYYHFDTFQGSDSPGYNLDFRDGIRLLTELQPHREYQSECAYCKRPGNTDRYAYGSIAERLQPGDYEAFLEGGWMRSGRFLYLPICEKACCPNIPIRLDVTQFQAAKRHKQVLSRMQAYMEGRRPIFKKTPHEASSGQQPDVQMSNSNTNSDNSKVPSVTSAVGSSSKDDNCLIRTIDLTLRNALKLIGRTRTSVTNFISTEAHRKKPIIDGIIESLQLWDEGSSGLIHKMNEKLYCSSAPAKMRKKYGYQVSSPVPLQLAQAVVKHNETLSNDKQFLSSLRLATAEILCNWINSNAICARVFQCCISSPGYLNITFHENRQHTSQEEATAIASEVYPEVLSRFRSMTGCDDPAMPHAQNGANGNSQFPRGSRRDAYDTCESERQDTFGVHTSPSNTPLMYNYTKFQKEHFAKYGEGYKHTLAVRLTRPYFTEAHLELYVRYNTEIHETEGKEQSKTSFMRHLVNSPIVFTPALTRAGDSVVTTSWPPAHDRSYHTSTPACSAHHPLDLYQPARDARPQLHWKGRDLAWDNWENYLSFTPAHLVHFLAHMRQRTRTESSSSSSDHEEDSCLDIPPSYRPRRRETRWTHGLEESSTFNLMHRLFAESEFHSSDVEHRPDDFDSDDKPLERFFCLRARYLQLLERSFLRLISSATYNAPLLQEAWESVYVPDSLQLPSFKELIKACEDVSHGMRKVEMGIAAHRNLANSHMDNVRTNYVKRTDYADGRDMLDKYLARDCHGNERTAETDGWDLRMGYGTFFQEYWLDGFLVCVSVLDILPTRLASVYCFYNPDLRHMEWGKYTALTEIYWTQRAAEHSPILRYVDMNYYVHRCGRMNYKRSYCPSELKCPYSLKWVPGEEALPRLDNDDHASLYPEGKRIKAQRQAQYEQLAPDVIPELCFCNPSSTKYPHLLASRKVSPTWIVSADSSAVALNRIRYIPWERFTEHYKSILSPRVVDWIQRVSPELANRIIVDPFALVYYAQKDEDEKEQSKQSSEGSMEEKD
eukprot:gb/GECG01015446.1/.p1 GENE.gb/GECG01015446.1/~~gb/GECG01015446.1/.p1  ORF type:complete len:1047 (+),score=114.87 gb/GECG01015446.1/:1-3141(+)